MVDNSSGQKIKCKICGKEFECGYAANMHVICNECSGDPLYGEMGYFDSSSTTKTDMVKSSQIGIDIQDG